MISVLFFATPFNISVAALRAVMILQVLMNVCY